ncbi:MAG: hypothetical protein WAV21_01595 [Minisyncoccia bacterium]
MKLEIPLIQQREGSYHCQIATLLMVLHYFDDKLEYDELLAELEPYLLDGGMHNQGAAIFMSKRGYKTLFAHHDLGVLSPDLEDKTEDDVASFKKALEETPQDDKNAYRREKLALDIEYIKTGGRYSSKLPTLALIDEYLENGVPVILGAVRNKGLHLKPAAGEGNHAIVITGKENDSYFINDPSPKSPGQYPISEDRLLHAWYNAGVHTRISWK